MILHERLMLAQTPWCMMQASVVEKQLNWRRKLRVRMLDGELKQRVSAGYTKLEEIRNAKLWGDTQG